ncbi:glyoxylate/hydroxypyruvate reductase A [Magnetovibrio sp.]|uniref:2-hydroxyacid dehydrogenase n=1 Tax=Magnetovibrio sp. TaxID=2024836 RepID=UPI002F92444A
MKIVFISPDDFAPWRKPLRLNIPEADVFAWGVDSIDENEIDYALVWKPAPGLLARFRNLKGIINLGAGVDALLQDHTLPQAVPLVRLVDERLTSGMVEYMVHWVLHFHRDLHVYARQQRARVWTQHDNADTQKRRVGILGLGELGQGCAHALLMLGFESLSGWSRTPKDLPGVRSFAGEDGLKPFLRQCEILLCLLPHTAATQGLLNAETLAELPQGAFIVNAGRGGLVVDDDLIAALESGHIAAAALDVFNTEPLPDDHPYWAMDNVFVTPHIASLTTPMSSSEIIAKTIRALENGEAPDNLVDFDQGY